MAKSNLVDITVLADASNYTKGRNKKIRCVTVHHMAGVLTAEVCGKIFQNPGRNASSHYGVGYDGRIGAYVDEDDTAWTNSNFASNSESVTIEVSNSATGGIWPVSDAAFDATVRLVADIAKRNDLGRLVPGDNLTWHRMFKNTSCPGDYLLSRMDEIAKRANDINFPPAPAETPEIVEIPFNLDDYTDEQLADKVMNGDFGDGDDRKKALGDRYNAVQAVVNKRLLPNEEKRKEPVTTDYKEGDIVVPVKLVDENGTPLVQYDDEYTVVQYNDSDKEKGRIVLGARGVIWAALKVENVRKK